MLKQGLGAEMNLNFPRVLLIWSGTPPSSPHMNESFIKTVSGLCLAPALDNINELSFQNAVYDTYQLSGLNRRMNPSCLNKNLIWHIFLNRM